MPFLVISNGSKLPFSEYKSLETVINKDLFLDIEMLLDAWFDPGVISMGFMSSGSGGSPKKIFHDKKSIHEAVQRSAKALDYGKDDRTILSLPVKYIAGAMMLLRAIILDMEICLDEISSRPLKNISYSIDFLALTPFQFNESYKYDRLRLEAIPVILLGGSPILAAQFKIFSSWKGKIYQSYGMTETLSHVALRRLDGKEEDQDYRAISQDISFQTNKDDCLVISAPYLAHSVVTTDHVKLFDDQSFQWLGRKDLIINSAGLKLNPEYIERHFSQSLEQKLFVFPVFDKRFGQRPAIIIEANKTRELVNEIIELNSQLEKNLRVDKAYFLSTLELTETGKINRPANIDKLDLTEFTQL